MIAIAIAIGIGIGEVNGLEEQGTKQENDQTLFDLYPFSFDL